MNPAKNTTFFNQRKQDKIENKYQMLAFPRVEQLCNRGKIVQDWQLQCSSLIRVIIDFLKAGLIM